MAEVKFKLFPSQNGVALTNQNGHQLPYTTRRYTGTKRLATNYDLHQRLALALNANTVS